MSNVFILPSGKSATKGKLVPLAQVAAQPIVDLLAKYHLCGITTDNKTLFCSKNKEACTHGHCEIYAIYYYESHPHEPKPHAHKLNIINNQIDINRGEDYGMWAVYFCSCGLKAGEEDIDPIFERLGKEHLDKE